MRSNFTVTFGSFSYLSPPNFPVGFPCDSAGKESAHDAGDPGSIPGLGRSPGKGKGYSLQYFGLKNSMDCIVLENSTDCIVHGIAKSRTRLSNFHYYYCC